MKILENLLDPASEVADSYPELVDEELDLDTKEAELMSDPRDACDPLNDDVSVLFSALTKRK